MMKRLVTSIFAALLIFSTSIASFATSNTTPVVINNRQDEISLYFDTIRNFEFTANKSRLQLTIKTYQNCSITAEIEIQDAFGNVVKSYSGSNNGSSVILIINRSYSLSSGFYTATCTVNAGGEVYTETAYF